MPEFNLVLAAVVGALQGFVGLPLIYYLVRPTVEVLLKPWEPPLWWTRILVTVSVFGFLLTVLLSAARPVLDGLVENRQRGGRIWALALFVGLLAHILVPAVESSLRRRKKPPE